MIENNICLLTDSYKVTHHAFYPKNTEKLYSYLESRVGSEFNKTIFLWSPIHNKKVFRRTSYNSRKSKPGKQSD